MRQKKSFARAYPGEHAQGNAVAVVGPMSAAQHAAHLLLTAAIRASIVKVDPEDGRGCGYGVSFPAKQIDNVRTILSSSGIFVKRFTDERWRTI